MAGDVTLVLMVGGWSRGVVGRVLRGAHEAAARDLLEMLLRDKRVGRAIVATDDADWAATLSHLPVEIDLDVADAPFVFGLRLAVLAERYGAERMLYTGGGAAPLMSMESWHAVLDRLAHSESLVVTNNVHSCDWVGFTDVGQALSWVAGELNDNAVAWVLSHQAGMPVESCPATASTRFDLDTPVDLLIARRHPAIGQHLRAYLNGLSWSSRQLDDVLAIMAREGTGLAIAGRVSSAAWDAIERATQCWIRVFAEERGMRASGRQARGEVRSLLAGYLREVGVERFFRELGGMVDGVLLDNRVILAALDIWPSMADRYHSDLLQWEDVGQPFLRRMTWAAAEAPIPIVMGGHSIVSGGLMALAEIVSAGKGVG